MTEFNQYGDIHAHPCSSEYKVTTFLPQYDNMRLLAYKLLGINYQVLIGKPGLDQILITMKSII